MGLSRQIHNKADYEKKREALLRYMRERYHLRKKDKIKQEEWAKEICTCGHPRNSHSNIETYCHKCKCNSFIKAETGSNDNENRKT